MRAVLKHLKLTGIEYDNEVNNFDTSAEMSCCNNILFLNNNSRCNSDLKIIGSMYINKDFNSINNLELIEVVKNSGNAGDRDLFRKNVRYRYSLLDKISIKVEDA
jgi:hypothetical protein